MRRGRLAFGPCSSDTRGFIRKKLDAMFKGYWRNLMQSQPNHVEILGEKNTVGSILRPVALEYTIPLTIGRGYCSLPPRHAMAERFRASGKEKLILLVVSDFDPEGEDIAHSLARSLRDDFGIDTIHAVKIALTAKQVAAHKLPPMMKAKRKSSRRRNSSIGMARMFSSWRRGAGHLAADRAAGHRISHRPRRLQRGNQRREGRRAFFGRPAPNRPRYAWPRPCPTWKGPTMNSPLLDAALDYRSRGLCVIPIRAGTKKAALRSWKPFQSQRPDDATLRDWFAAGGKGLAIVCGQVSGGLIVRDFDQQAAYNRWASDHADLAGKLPTAATARGRHVYGRIPERRGIVTLADGELRGDGGYVLAPPSIHPAGTAYRWIVPLNGELPIIDLLSAGFIPCNTVVAVDTEDPVDTADTRQSPAPLPCPTVLHSGPIELAIASTCQCKSASGANAFSTLPAG